MLSPLCQETRHGREYRGPSRSFLHGTKQPFGQCSAPVAGLGNLSGKHVSADALIMELKIGTNALVASFRGVGIPIKSNPRETLIAVTIRFLVCLEITVL